MIDMFTGLVGELGTVKSCVRNGANSYKLSISAKDTLTDLKLGDSIAVNGACFTVVEIGEAFFVVDIMPESSKNTVIEGFKSGDKVNLEKALRVGDRLDGHIVSGHVEYIGKITEYKKDGIAYVVKVSVITEAMRYIVNKGSIAIDGISLTVSAVGKDYFCVSLIPHTVKNTTLNFKKEGSMVNIETDILCKYVENLLSLPKVTKENGITYSKLLENGF